MNRRVLLGCIIVCLMIVVCIIGMKERVSADCHNTEITGVENNNKSIKQVRIELKKNGYTDDELDIAYYLEMAEALKQEGLTVDEIIERIDKEAEKQEKNDSRKMSKADKVIRAIIGWMELNKIEKKLYVAHPFAALRVHAASKKAAQYSYEQFGNNGVGDKTDAFRHAVWCAIMARDIGPDLAKKFSDAHENGYTEEELAAEVMDGNTGYAHKDMDLYNNAIGLSIGSGEHKSDEQIVELAKEQLTDIRGNGLIWLNDWQ